MEKRGFFYDMRNKMANIFQFLNGKNFSYFKYEKFRLQICLKFFMSLTISWILFRYIINIQTEKNATFMYKSRTYLQMKFFTFEI